MRKLAVVLWAGQVLAAVLLLVTALIDVELILGSGPIFSLTGLALAAVTCRLSSSMPLAFGLSAVLVCGLAAALIAINHWGPPDAATPVAVIAAAYLVLAAPLAIASLRAILRWQVVAFGPSAATWRFGMKAMMVWMTAACILIAAGQFVVRRTIQGLPRQDESLMFLSFAAVAAALSGVVLWRFIAARRVRRVHTDETTAK